MKVYRKNSSGLKTTSIPIYIPEWRFRRPGKREGSAGKDMKGRLRKW